MARRKRRNLHKDILEEIYPYLDEQWLEYVKVEMHTTSMRRMPANLAGIPDLIVSTCDHTTYVEIKPFYTKSRDQLNDRQCEFCCDIYPIVSKSTRYWVISDFAQFCGLWKTNSQFYMEDYHQQRIARWCETRGRELPW